MNPKERFINALLGKPKDYTPPTCVTQIALVESMEAFNAKWPEAHKDPQKMATLGVSLYKLAELETARIPFCLTVIADALGAKVDLGTIDIQPSVKEHPFASADQVKIPEDFLERGRIPVVLEATKILKEKWGNTLPILVGFEAPITLAGHLVGTERLLIWMIKKRNEVKELLKKTTEADVIYVNALLKAGADVLVPCDPTASPDMISPLDFRELVKPNLIELMKSVKGYFVLHICGKTKPIVKDMAETGAHGISIEDKVDIRYAKEAAGDKAKIIGNVSTSKTIFMGTPDEVKEEAKKVLDAEVDLLAPACGIPPISPLDNIKALVTAVKEYYKL
ncbi:MAG: MtaA/CmuA family methyltransferase [archaeon]|nr:MtaA/CmuA family methyltransferase [archaeon]MCP8315121.1 MtaA/CmuA family methyltransferase [archaeon]MCP8316858.1 MtaA/CmuA family methyltransferase [archaeon]MCP8320036.1 MtaA/CmuA family methyltransferase [archaeon]